MSSGDLARAPIGSFAADDPARAPLVSVVIPCHDAEAHLEETLESVYAQRFTNWEIIAVDDGSIDGTAGILDRHRDRLQAVRQENRGPGAARQRGLDAARGRFVQYLDADDLLGPEALETRVRALEDTGADVAYGDWQRLVRDDTGHWLHGAAITRRIDAVDDDPELACFRSFWCPPVALMYRRSLCDRIGGWHSSLPVIDDARYLVDAAAAGARFVHVPGVSAYYREHATSLSRRKVHALAENVHRNAEELLERWQRTDRLAPRRARALEECFGYVAREAFRRDPALFRRAADRIAELGGRQRWVTIASMLERSVGHRGALAVLRLLRRPAP